VYFIHDELTAWCFDRAVTMFGTAVEEDIEKAVSKVKGEANKRAAGLRAWRRWMNEKGSTKGLFRDPAARM
jgi:hypothetical protein